MKKTGKQRVSSVDNARAFGALERTRMTFPIAAVVSGTLIFVAVMIAIFFAVVYGFHTFKGSGINAHPNDGLDGAPGSADPSVASGKGRTTEDHDDEFSAGGGFSTHGTR